MVGAVGFEANAEKRVGIPVFFGEGDKVLREIVRVPHGVKLVTAEKIENDENLREWFDL